MKEYIGTKRVLAKGMSLYDFNIYMGRKVPNTADKVGMLVEYLDGGDPNHPDHKGHISWCPIDVFLKENQPYTTNMDKMLYERDKLNDLIKAYTEEPIDDITALQVNKMHSYLRILDKRVNDDRL